MLSWLARWEKESVEAIGAARATECWSGSQLVNVNKGRLKGSSMADAHFV